MLMKSAFFLLPFIYMFRFLLFRNNEQVYIAVFITSISIVSLSLFVKYILMRYESFPKGNVLYLFVILYMLLSLMYLKYTFMLISGISLLIVYLGIIIFADYISSKQIFWEIYHSYSLGIFFLCMILQLAVHLKVFDMTFIDNRFGWVLYKDFSISDPNYFAVFIGLAMLYFYFTFSNRKAKEKKRFLHLTLFLVLAYFLMITLSRGVVLSIIITLVVISIVKEWGNIKFILAGCLLPIFFALGWFLVSKFGSSNAENVNYATMDRFLLLNSSDRIAVWTTIFNGFRQSGLLTVLIGNGFQSGSSVGAKFYLGIDPQSNSFLFKNPHNMFLQLLVELGIVGIIILLTISIMYTWQTIKSLKRKNYVPLALLLFFVGVNVSLNVMGFRELALIFGSLLLASNRIGESSNQKGDGSSGEIQSNHGNAGKEGGSERVFSLS